MMVAVPVCSMIDLDFVSSHKNIPRQSGNIQQNENITN
jgi:hypothetical protein